MRAVALIACLCVAAAPAPALARAKPGRAELRKAYRRVVVALKHNRPAFCTGYATKARRQTIADALVAANYTGMGCTGAMDASLGSEIYRAWFAGRRPATTRALDTRHGVITMAGTGPTWFMCLTYVDDPHYGTPARWRWGWGNSPSCGR